MTPKVLTALVEERRDDPDLDIVMERGIGLDEFSFREVFVEGGFPHKDCGVIWQGSLKIWGYITLPVSCNQI